MSVLEGRVGHAKRFGGTVHAARKGGLGAGNGLTDGGGGIIGGFHRGPANQIADRYSLTGFQAEFGRLFVRRIS